MLRRVSPLDGESVLSLAEAKAQCRVLHSDEDNLIRALRNAAVTHVERESGVILAPADFVWETKHFPRDFPIKPVTALGAVTYLGAAGTDVTYTGARLSNGQVLPVFGQCWPYTYGRVSIAFTAGLEDLSIVSDLLAAIRLLTAHWYAHREAATEQAPAEIPMGVAALIQSHRAVLV